MIKLRLLSFCCLLFVFLYTPSQAQTLPYPVIDVCFTPGQDCTSRITNALDKAKKLILVQAYSFTSAPIAKHLVAAKNRGVVVKVILDKSQRSERYSAAKFLINHHIPVWIDYRPAIAHNKIMIIDGQEIITGSFNFTKAAQQKNAENLLVIQDSALAQRYTENWQRRFAASETFNAQYAEAKYQKTRHHHSHKNWFALR